MSNYYLFTSFRSVYYFSLKKCDTFFIREKKYPLPLFLIQKKKANRCHCLYKSDLLGRRSLLFSQMHIYGGMKIVIMVIYIFVAVSYFLLWWRCIWNMCHTFFFTLSHVTSPFYVYDRENPRVKPKHTNYPILGDAKNHFYTKSDLIIKLHNVENQRNYRQGVSSRVIGIFDTFIFDRT